MASSVNGFYDPKTKILNGPEQFKYYHPDASLGFVLLNKFDDDPNNVYQINDTSGKKLTGKEMKSLTIRIAQNLLHKGLKETDIIGILSRNVDYLAPLVYGAFTSGIPVNCLDISFSIGEIQHIFGLTRPKIIFCDIIAYDNLKKALSLLKVKTPIYIMNGKVDDANGQIEDFLTELAPEKTFRAPTFKEGGDHTAAILCSSGSTGLPKGVCLSHKKLMTQVPTALNCDDVLLCYSSLYWFSGVSMLIISGLVGSTRILTEDSFTVNNFLGLIEKYQVSFVLSAPSQMALILAGTEIKTYNLSSVRRYLLSGSSVSQTMAMNLQKHLKDGIVLNGYGMTEVGGLCTMGIVAMNPASVGRIKEGTQIKIINDLGESLDAGLKGEICIRSDMKWKGYYGNKESTLEIYDKDGWVHSGDLGYIDEYGCLYIVDRKKDVFKYKNYPICPNEIEQVITKIPGVIEVCVCGVPDEIAIEIPAAAIVTAKDSKLNEKIIKEFVAKHVNDAKQLRGGVHFMNSLPKTASGKILRNEIKNLLKSR